MHTLPDEEMAFWRQTAPKSRYTKLSADIVTDTVIIGGGITGLTVAYLLKQAGQKVAVLEKDTIGSGTTGHTTGKVTSQHNLIYQELRSRLGDRTARVYGLANQAAIAQIEKVIKKEKIDCGFTRADNYVFTTDPARRVQFEEEAATAAILGLPASFTTRVGLPFPVSSAVKFNNQAYMNAQAYTVGLAKAVNGSGSHIFESTRATTIHDGKRPKVRTSAGMVLAKNIIVATNVPTFPLVARASYCFAEYPHTSYIVACQAKNMPAGMYISPDKDNYSILPVRYKGQSLLLVGGSNHIRGLSLGKKHHYKKLAAYGQAKLGATAVKYIWSAHDYLAYDDLPLVGKVYPWSKHLYTATAFRKWGLTNSFVAAETLRDMILGNKNDGADIFDPHRFTAPASIPHAIAKFFD